MAKVRMSLGTFVSLTHCVSGLVPAAPDTEIYCRDCEHFAPEMATGCAFTADVNKRKVQGDDVATALPCFYPKDEL